jgi:O-antigen ligase
MLFIMTNKNIEDVLFYILIIITPLTFTKLTPDNHLAIKLTLLSTVLFFFSLYILFKSGKNRLIEINKVVSIFFSSLIIFIIFIGISLFYTINLTDGLFFFVKTILFLCYTIILFLQFDNPISFINKCTRSFSILGFIIIAIGIYQLVALQLLEEVSHSNLYKISACFGNKNIYSQVLLLILPFSIFSLFNQKIIWKIIGVFNTVIIIILITILMTRSVWVAAIASFLTAISVGIITLKPSYFNLKKTVAFIFIIVILISTTTILYSKFDSSDAFKKQISSIFNFKYGSTNDRIILWEKSLELAAEKPFFGNGAGSWKVNILKYGNKNLSSEDNVTFFQRPHNDYIWVLCEQGAIGLILYLILFLISIYSAIKLLKSEYEKEVKIYTFLIFFALMSYMIFSFFIFPYERIEFIIFLSVIFSSLLILINNKKAKSILHLNARHLLIITSFILFCTTIFGFSRLISEIHLHKAYKARATNNWNKLIFEIDKSEKAIYKIDPFSTPISWYRGLAKFNKGNYTEAFADFNSAYKINPYHIHVLNNLATCKGLTKEYSSALELYKEALRISPDFEDAIYNICGIYQQLNDIESAISYIKKIKKPVNKDRYQKVILILARQKLNELYNSVNEVETKIYIHSVLHNQNNILEIFQESIKNNCSIEQQILLNTTKK